MSRRYVFDELRSIVPPRLLHHLHEKRPKKSKLKHSPVAKHTDTQVLALPSPQKPLQRYLLQQSKPQFLYKTAPRRSPAPDFNLLSLKHAHFPFADFYTPKGVFKRQQATDCLNFMMSKMYAPPSHFVISLFLESLWRSDSNWQNLLQEKMRVMRIHTFRTPQIVVQAMEARRTDVVDALLAYNDHVAFKEVAAHAISTRNITVLEKIYPRLNISNRNDLLFQALVAHHNDERFTAMWEYLLLGANGYKVASKMLYMRHCQAADVLLVHPSLPHALVEEVWRYAQKAQLEDELPKTSARRTHHVLCEQLHGLVAEAGEGGRRRL